MTEPPQVHSISDIISALGLHIKGEKASDQQYFYACIPDPEYKSDPQNAKILARLLFFFWINVCRNRVPNRTRCPIMASLLCISNCPYSDDDPGDGWCWCKCLMHLSIYIPCIFYVYSMYILHIFGCWRVLLKKHTTTRYLWYLEFDDSFTFAREFFLLQILQQYSYA